MSEPICNTFVIGDYYPETNEFDVRGYREECMLESQFLGDYYDYHTMFFERFHDTCSVQNIKINLSRFSFSSMKSSQLKKQPPEPLTQTELEVELLPGEDADQKLYTPKQQELLNIGRKYSKLMKEKYGEEMGVVETGSESNFTVGESTLLVGFENIDSDDSPQEIINMLIDDLYDEGVIPEGWQVVEIIEPEMVFGDTFSSFMFKIVVKDPSFM